MFFFLNIASVVLLCQCVIVYCLNVSFLCEVILKVNNKVFSSRQLCPEDLHM